MLLLLLLFLCRKKILGLVHKISYKMVLLRTNNFVAKYENKNNKIIIGVDENRIMNNFNNNN